MVHVDMITDEDFAKVYKLLCTLMFQYLQVLFPSNLDLSSIIRKGNDWYHFGPDYVTSLYLTNRSLRYTYPGL